MLLRTTQPSRLGYLQTNLRPFPVKAKNFDQFLDGPIAKDLLADFIMMRQFPVVGGEVACANPGTLEIPAFGGGQGQRGSRETDSQVYLAGSKNRARIIHPFGLRPPTAKQLNRNSSPSNVVDDDGSFRFFGTEEAQFVFKIG